MFRMDDKQQSQLIFYVNGKKVVEDQPDPEMTLLPYLRNKLRLTGSKQGCGVGGCGACTVMLSKYDRSNKQIIHYSVNACLAPLCSLHGLAVTTVEGIGNTKKLHPVQERLAKAHGSQCGFCTPGMVMSMYALLRNKPEPSMREIEEVLVGNLCRCTGYRPILQGFSSFSKDYQCGMGEECCRNKDTAAKTEIACVSEMRDSSQFAPYDPSQEPIFPSQLQLSDDLDNESLVFKSERVTWYRPRTMEELLELKTRFPSATLLAGNTKIGLDIKYQNLPYPVLIAYNNIRELHCVEQTEEGIRFGASTTVSQFQKILRETVTKLPEPKTRLNEAFLEMLRRFAGSQIRNVATVVGSVISASPTSDLTGLLMCAGCVLTVSSPDNGRRREIVLDQSFFPGYRQTVLKSTDVVTSFYLPFTCQNEYYAAYKQSQRRDDSTAIVNAAMRVVFEEKSNIIKALTVIYGGMGPNLITAKETGKRLRGHKWDDDLPGKAYEQLEKDLPLPPGSPGGMESYRKVLATSLFFKFYLNIQTKLFEQVGLSQTIVPDSYKSATTAYHRNASRGIQVYEDVPLDQPDQDTIGRPHIHTSGYKHATGQALYCDDIPVYEDELQLSLVTSTKAHAHIVSVDPTEALKMPGVVDYIDYKDVPGSNICETSHGERIFAEKTVYCQGQVIGAILSKSRVQGRSAANAVKVEYKELKPVMTIEDAIKAKEALVPTRVTSRGNVDQGLAESDHVITGEVEIGGQEHFYLETQSCFAVPSEDGEMEIFCSTQDLDLIQIMVSSTLNVPRNKIVARIKRVGGGFGGKVGPILLGGLPAVVAANKHKKPVRCVLDRDEDIAITGARHPYIGKYKVGFTSSGKIMALDLTMYSNDGCNISTSVEVLEMAIFSSDSGYFIPNFKITGFCLETNRPTNTAFRGFGKPQGMFICETWISHVADYLQFSPESVKKLNMYKDGDLALDNQTLERCNLGRCWNEVIAQSNFDATKAEFASFNKQNRWKKRGIAVVPLKYGVDVCVSMGIKTQALALVHIYLDGSVGLNFGGIEIGQGLHTKMIQIASRVLKIPTDRIHVLENNTALVANPTPTGGSFSSDINGMAVLYACETIMKRLEPFIKANPEKNWVDWVNAAYFERVSLSATGFYKYPRPCYYDWDKKSGDVYLYYTYGACCSQVEIDCLTGDHTVLKTDIVMDVGQSLNPAIDIGQIEGGFLQGLGYTTIEKHSFSPDGYLRTRGPNTYKIPCVTDIPVEFNVSLLKGSSNPKAVYSSKGIGEPAFLLGKTVFFAIKDAIKAAREEAGLKGYFQLNCPATAEAIRMACVDHFTKQFPEAEPGTHTPWVLSM